MIQVTVASSFPSDEPSHPSNYRFLYIPVENENLEKNIIFPTFIKEAEAGRTAYSNMMTYIISLSKRSEEALNHPEIMKIKNETFDLLILGHYGLDFQMGLAAHFHCPLIIVTTLKATTVTKRLMGNPLGVSYVPSVFATHTGTGPMNFWQRISNFLIISAESLVTTAVNYFINEPYYERNFPKEQYLTLDEVKKNISLILINHHFSQSTVEPFFPTMIEVSGMHIKPAESIKLPKVIIFHFH